MPSDPLWVLAAPQSSHSHQRDGGQSAVLCCYAPVHTTSGCAHVCECVDTYEFPLYGTRTKHRSPEGEAESIAGLGPKHRPYLREVPNRLQSQGCSSQLHTGSPTRSSSTMVGMHAPVHVCKVWKVPEKPSFLFAWEPWLSDKVMVATHWALL